ncbi:nuclear transport factor 2 family protein [uncultured Tenacibaculum sp.]|uniref:nuclear transport factor 2 family protein n=1 Tax=uncultured Tenacibaculum sp. TaxID=174713 RepID=UPI00262B2906|nr:nuclear transport factor 2 family protein [uncultured Tenacibaculum sp.]
MNKNQVATSYLQFLENGEIEKVIELFDENGIVESPIYGVKKASVFYRELQNDTSKSELELKGIFEQNDSNTIALYFLYKWTLKNNKIVEFDVVDIIDINTEGKITKLKIIYDTVISRRLVDELE